MAEHIIEASNESLFGLVSEANTGELALPQFQRDFVWRPEDVRQLLVSVFSGYYIGALLLLKTDKYELPFSCRAVRGSNIEAKSLEGKSSRVLLDGQQRITSIYYAFYGPDFPLKGRSKNPTMFFLRLKKLFSDEIDEAVFYEPMNRCKPEWLEPGEWQFRELTVPLRGLDKDGWSRWRTDYADWLRDADNVAYKKWKDDEVSKWDNKIGSVHSYQSSTLTLPQIEPNNRYQLEQICTIFEKLNSTGVKLTAFDLLTARLYPHQIDLDEMWNAALEDSSCLSSLGNIDKADYGIYILRCIALLRNEDSKNRALVNLSHINFKRDWDIAIKYFDEAYSRMTSVQDDGFGVLDQKWIPYPPMIPVLAALIAKRDNLTDSRKASANGTIRWWYWGSVFVERYAHSVESVTSRDFAEICKFFEDPEQYPELFIDVYRDIVQDTADYEILDIANVKNTLFQAVMCLLAKNGARDFRQNESIVYSNLDAHHIFPRGFLKQLAPVRVFNLSEKDSINTVINQTLISKETNKAISSKSPSEYLNLDSIIPQDEKSDILKCHFIDEACLEALEANDYEKFLKCRHQEIVKKVLALFKDFPKPPGGLENPE